MKVIVRSLALKVENLQFETVALIHKILEVENETLRRVLAVRTSLLLELQ
jgi:hypothetical protein